MIFTSIKHRIQIKTPGCEMETHDSRTFDTDDFDITNTEHMVAWFHQVLENQRPSYRSFDDGHIDVTPDLKRVQMWQTDHNDDFQNEWDVWIETTLANNKAKNPKKWSVKIRLLDNANAGTTHLIEWNRLPEEELSWAGLRAGVARRNIFGVLRK